MMMMMSIPGEMNHVFFDGNDMNGNTTISFSSLLAAAAAVTVAYQWVRHVYST